MQKHLFPAPSCGPYTIDRQPAHTSVVLRDRKTGELVDRGAYIPLDQILVAPLRTPVEFSQEPDVRSFSEMLEGRTRVAAPGTKQGKPGKRAGWDKLGVGAFVAYQAVPSGPHKRELLVNNKNEQNVVVQPYRDVFAGVRVQHKPQYLDRNECRTSEVGPIAQEQVKYQALVLAVELLTWGELMHGYARSLSARGWGLLFEEKENIAFLDQCRLRKRPQSRGGAHPCGQNFQSVALFRRNYGSWRNIRGAYISTR